MKKLAAVVFVMMISIVISCSYNVNANKKSVVEIKSSEATKSTIALKPRIISKIVNSRSNTRMKNTNFKVHYQGKAVVLIYHDISQKHGGRITITPERFEADLKMLSENGFRVISLSDMINAMNSKGNMPDNAVVITFDDGIDSFYSYAYPLLLKYHMPATNFIISSRNETYMNFKNGETPLSPQEITEMYNSGLIDIYSHTNESHEYVYINSELKKGAKLTNRIYDKVTGTLESESDYEKRVMEDLKKSREIINKYTGTNCTVLCFPFGIFNKKVIELARKCGYNYFVTTIKGVNSQDSTEDKIYRIHGGDEGLNSEKLLENIINIGSNRKVH